MHQNLVGYFEFKIAIFSADFLLVEIIKLETIFQS